MRARVLMALTMTPATAVLGQEMPPAVCSVGAAYDTWEWDGTAWRLTASTGPIPRNSPALAYDEARHQIVMFGGDTRKTGALGDAWVYDGNAWRQVAWRNR
jgi:hypothetical protein